MKTEEDEMKQKYLSMNEKELLVEMIVALKDIKRAVKFVELELSVIKQQLKK